MGSPAARVPRQLQHVEVVFIVRVGVQGEARRPLVEVPQAPDLERHTAGRANPICTRPHTLNDSPHPHSDFTCGLTNLKPFCWKVSTKSKVVPFR